MLSASAYASDRNCWTLVDVEPVFKQWANRELVPIGGDNVTRHLTMGTSRQWMEFDDPGYSSGRAHILASWSPPPTRFCKGERVEFDLSLKNLAVGQPGNVLGSVSWGPNQAYGKPLSGRLTLARHQSFVDRQGNTRLHRGPDSPGDPGVWLATVSIGNLYTQVHYRYRPDDPAPGTARLTAADIAEQSPSLAFPPGHLPPEPTHSAQIPATGARLSSSATAHDSRSAAPDSGHLSGQQRLLLDDFGPPHAFTRVALPDEDGKPVVYDAWAYYDGQIVYIFVNGLLLRSEGIGVVAGEVQPTGLQPALFEMGSDREALQQALGGLRWTRLDSLEAFMGRHAGPIETWTAGTALLGFQNGALVFVDARAGLREGAR